MAKQAAKSTDEKEAELDQIRPAMPVDAYYDGFKKNLAEMPEETRTLWERYQALLKERGIDAVP